MTADAEIAPFDICGPLPQGVTVLEASAGTGKTFAIAALATRFVAEGVRLEELLLVTFTRMATGELRERVRERLVSADLGLALAQSGVVPPAEDTVLCLLASGTPEELTLRRERIGRALRDFDAATISTIHGFCQQVLGSLGVNGDVERDVAFIEDVRDLVDEVVDDLFVRRFRGSDHAPLFDRAEALRIGQAAVANPDAVLEPADAPAMSAPAMRYRLAQAVRSEVDSRKRRASLLTFDDLVSRVRDTLADPQRGEAAAALLRRRYRVALVDEFQDTDPLQWEIMRRAFGGGRAALVLIGDPKQAIYAFRGADVYAYLEAARTAGTRATLGINWRSDQGLIEAYDAVFGGARLGHEDIVYRTVEAAPPHRQPRLTGAPVSTPLRVRILHREDGLAPLGKGGFVGVVAARELIARDLAGDVVRLLSSEAELDQGSGAARRGRVRVRPGHVAVLVRAHGHAAVVQDALGAAGIPAVVNGGGSVFATPMAGAWLRLIEALEQPTSASRARSAGLTVFLGWSAERMAGAGDDALEDLQVRLHRWAAVLTRRGVAALLETMALGEGLPRRLLAHPGGERMLTDLRHVGNLLHAEATAEQLGITAMAAWLRRRITDAARDAEGEDRTRRLESDAEAVQVLTVHRSKGLEFPIVYCPYLWDPAPTFAAEPPVFHDIDAGDVRTLDIGGSEGAGFHAHQAQHQGEERGEQLRLAYVALTRAQHQAVVWWAGSQGCRHSPLCRLLFSRDDRGNVASAGTTTPPDARVVARFEDLAERVPGRLSVERVALSDGGAVWSTSAPPAMVLEAARLRRGIDRWWRRTSYSGITARAHEVLVASEPEEPALADEATDRGGAPPLGDEATDGGGAPPVAEGAAGGGGAPPLAEGAAGGGGAPPLAEEAAGRGGAPALSDPAGGVEARLRAVPSAFAWSPAGAEFGSFVHGVLEAVDFTAVDLHAEVAGRVRQSQVWRHSEIGDAGGLTEALCRAIETPLGPLAGEVRLRDISRADRLSELSFELPLAGGDTPAGSLTVRGISRLLAEHVPAGDPLTGYAGRLDDPLLAGEIRGYLTGSLDLVLRLRDPGGGVRFAVADHKTNRLGVEGEQLSAWHYRPSALAEEMQRAHYPLQGLLYTTALHRYLRWRLPGYDPERNLVGILYLFLRGMVGGEAPRVDGQPCGVFAWRPPTALVVALSDLLDHGSARP